MGIIWASLVAQLINNLPAMRETWVQSLVWEDPLPGEGKGYSLQYSGLENSMDCIVHWVAKSQTQLRDFHFHLWYNLENRSSSNQEEFTNTLFKLQFMCVRNC